MTMGNPAKIRAVQLTHPQIELLTDIATKPQMYITYQSRWDQTATSLVRKDLAAKRFAGSGHQYELRITEAGKAEAARRGIIAPACQGSGDTNEYPGRTDVDG